jgi:hypothetical protein
MYATLHVQHDPGAPSAGEPAVGMGAANDPDSYPGDRDHDDDLHLARGLARVIGLGFIIWMLVGALVYMLSLGGRAP